MIWNAVKPPTKTATSTNAAINPFRETTATLSVAFVGAEVGRVDGEMDGMLLG